MQSDEQNFFPHLIDNEENSFVTLWPSQTSLTASYSCVFWKYALSTVQKFLWASKKKNVSYESHSNSTMKSLLHVQLIYNSHFDFLILQFTCCHLATVLCFVWETSFWKVIHLCLCFLFFFFFFSQIEFFNQNDDVLPFSQFPPERFLYLNVGLISLDVWLVDKILFLIFLSCASTFI